MTPATRRPPLIIAHRGFHRRVRENTRESILAARDVGAHGVEFDVRTTADGLFVLHHNRTRRFRRRQRPISLFERSDLPAWIPSLEAILRRTSRWDDFLLDVELKDASVPARLLEMLRGIPSQRLVVTSFHQDVCKTIVASLPGIRVGWLRERPEARDLAVARRNRFAMLVVHRRGLRPNVAAAAKRHGIVLWTWGINSVRRARWAVQFGVEGIITDRPDVLLRADLTKPAPPKTSRRTGRPGN